MSSPYEINTTVPYINRPVENRCSMLRPACTTIYLAMDHVHAITMLASTMTGENCVWNSGISGSKLVPLHETNHNSTVSEWFLPYRRAAWSSCVLTLNFRFYSNISQILLFYKTWQCKDKFDFTKSLGAYYLYFKIPQCSEHGLKYVAFYVQKHIAQSSTCYNLPLFRDMPLGAPAFVKLVYLHLPYCQCA